MTVVRHERKNGRPVSNGSEKPRDRAFEHVGRMMEMQTDLESMAADLDDDDLSQAVFLVRLKLTVIGNLLARRRNV